MNTRHLDPVKKLISNLSITNPPLPWRKVADIGIGGLNAIGFDSNNELLLVYSSTGRGLINCETGEKIARDTSESESLNNYLELKGIGLIADKNVVMSGKYGGGLPNGTNDGWSIQSPVLNWPITEVILLEPFNDLYAPLHGKAVKAYKLFSDYEIVAAGFSYTGRSLVIASTSDLIIWIR